MVVIYHIASVNTIDGQWATDSDCAVVLQDHVGLVECEALAVPDPAVHPRGTGDGSLGIRGVVHELVRDLADTHIHIYIYGRVVR